MSTQLMRLILVSIVWIVFAVLSGTLLIVQREDANFIMVGVFAAAAVFGTAAVMETTKEQPETVEATKRKRTSADAAAYAYADPQTQLLLSLLDADDLAELRAHLRNRLMDKVERPTDGELSSLNSLDALMDEQETYRIKRSERN